MVTSQTAGMSALSKFKAIISSEAPSGNSMSLTITPTAEDSVICIALISLVNLDGNGVLDITVSDDSDTFYSAEITRLGTKDAALVNDHLLPARPGQSVTIEATGTDLTSGKIYASYLEYAE